MLVRISSPAGTFRNRSRPRRKRSTMKVCHAENAHDVQTTDVLVVGSGLAGMSATVTLVKQGVPVVLIEADAALGGNSCKASSGMNSMTQQMNDSAEDFVNDIIVSGGDLCDRELVNTLVRESEEAMHFIQGMGVDMSKVSQLGGHSHARTHRNPSGPNVGFAIMKPLMEYVNSHDGVQVLTNCRLMDLNPSGQHYIAECTCGAPEKDEHELKLQCRSVILAAGGFAGSPQALSSVAPALSGIPTTNKLTAVAGSVLSIAEKAGAELTQVDQVQVHPTAFVDPQEPAAHSKILAPEALRGHGAILVDGTGRRFVNELATRDVVTAAMSSARGPVWMILPKAGAAAFGMAAISFYCSKGLMAKVNGPLELAEHMSVQSEGLRKSFMTYNDHHSASKSGPCQDDFGKMSFPAAMPVGIEEAMYVAQVTPAVHYCMGGIKFTVNAEVLSKERNIIPGLFAAGEVTGGLHGHNRLAGCSLLDCVVFGRRAGFSAAQYLGGAN